MSRYNDPLPGGQRAAGAHRVPAKGVSEISDRPPASGRGSIIDGTDIIECSAKELYEIRIIRSALFQDGALVRR